MKEYRLLVVGHPVANWCSVWTSAEMLTRGIVTAFEEMSHVRVYVKDVADFGKKVFPPVDFVLLVIYGNERDRVRGIGEYVHARKTVSFREVPLANDHAFVFKQPDIECEHTRIQLPCCKALLQYTAKKPNTVLIDHSWDEFVGTDDDWTCRIEDWLSVLPNEIWKFFRLVRTTPDRMRAAKFADKLEYQHYVDYLDATSSIERFIITHRESFPWGVIDMTARGAQVIAPCGFLPHDLVSDLGIEVFHGQESLLNILSRQVPESWKHKINLCTDFSECARIIDAKFQKWMPRKKVAVALSLTGKGNANG